MKSEWFEFLALDRYFPIKITQVLLQDEAPAQERICSCFSTRHQGGQLLQPARDHPVIDGGTHYSFALDRDHGLVLFTRTQYLGQGVDQLNFGSLEGFPETQNPDQIGHAEKANPPRCHGVSLPSSVGSEPPGLARFDDACGARGRRLRRIALHRDWKLESCFLGADNGAVCYSGHTTSP
jgi:hypothetical protein